MIKDDSKAEITITVNTKDRVKIKKSIWRKIKNKMRKKEY